MVKTSTKIYKARGKPLYCCWVLFIWHNQSIHQSISQLANKPATNQSTMDRSINQSINQSSNQWTKVQINKRHIILQQKSYFRTILVRFLFHSLKIITKICNYQLRNLGHYDYELQLRNFQSKSATFDCLLNFCYVIWKTSTSVSTIRTRYCWAEVVVAVQKPSEIYEDTKEHGTLIK